MSKMGKGFGDKLDGISDFTNEDESKGLKEYYYYLVNLSLTQTFDIY